ncbi:acyl-CoA carboxylase subunit epsilon [Nonomuraea sp. NPDC026600]|uniref:acyl-CoA carboxylase subunit epsilon n=1 Tax=Nonomuraea sp. NPDC026600 TaxID=3155363 RepID=UPI0033FF603E
MNVVKGNPSQEELAALVLAFLVMQAPAPATPPPFPRRVLRRPLATDPRGWRESRWTLGGVL